MRSLPCLGLACIAAGIACDRSGPLADVDASSPWPRSSAPTLAAAPSPAPSSIPAPTRAMPPRPVPTSSPTVRITMPLDTQLQAIQYMAAMQAPQPSDAPVDPEYAKQLAQNLAPVGKVDVISSGRLIDIVVPKCDATLPREAIARHTGASLATLLAHGVLVVRCRDRELQCVQSMRDADDVLCVHK